MDQDKEISTQEPLETDSDVSAVKKKKSSKKTMIILAAVAVVVAVAGVIGFFVYQHNQEAEQAAKLESTYQRAISAKDLGDYEEAMDLFEKLGDYKESVAMAQECLDAQVLDMLQSQYSYITAVYAVDNDLADTVSEIIYLVDYASDAAETFSFPGIALDNLYNGLGYRVHNACGLVTANRIKSKIPSAQIVKGSSTYEVYISVFSQANAEDFVARLESANSIVEDVEAATADVKDVSIGSKYQDVQERLLSAYEAVMDYHSLVKETPSNYKEYDEIVQQKQIAVDNALAAAKELEPTIDEKVQSAE